jgi:hypothetical protein
MDRNFTIVSSEEEGARFDAVLADPEFAEIEYQPQTGAYGRAYYPAVHGDKHRVFSFAVFWRNNPILVVLCSDLDGVLGLHGLPMRVFARPGLEFDVERSAVRTAFSHVDGLVQTHGIHEVCVRERSSAVLSPVGEACLGRQATPNVALIGMVDLEAGPVVWKRALRKSFQQFINWGRKSFEISHINAGQFSTEAFDAYRLFHAEIAGRVTRPRSSWDEMYRAVAQGRGELLLAYLNGKLAAGSLFIDGTQTTVYMNGVYDRDLEKPLAHFLIWHGIERAHGRGMRTFQLGDIHIRGAVDEKRYQVGYFKRGFATHLDTYLDWRWRIGNPEPVAEAEASPG